MQMRVIGEEFHDGFVGGVNIFRVARKRHPAKWSLAFAKQRTYKSGHKAGEFKDATNSLYLGRGYNFPVALEGALKLKEISYIHAEGYPAAEMKHGPIALIDENMPVFVIATNLSAYDKIVSNIQEVKARKGVVVAVVTEGDQTIKKLADYTIEIPDTEEPLTRSPEAKLVLSKGAVTL